MASAPAIRASGVCAENMALSASVSACDFGFGCAMRPGTATASANTPLKIIRFIKAPLVGLLLLVTLLDTMLCCLPRGIRCALHRQRLLIALGGRFPLACRIGKAPQI